MAARGPQHCPVCGLPVEQGITAAGLGPQERPGSSRSAISPSIPPAPSATPPPSSARSANGPGRPGAPDGRAGGAAPPESLTPCGGASSASAPPPAGSGWCAGPFATAAGTPRPSRTCGPSSAPRASRRWGATTASSCGTAGPTAHPPRTPASGILRPCAGGSPSRSTPSARPEGSRGFALRASYGNACCP